MTLRIHRFGPIDFAGCPQRGSHSLPRIAENRFLEAFTVWFGQGGEREITVSVSEAIRRHDFRPRAGIRNDVEIVDWDSEVEKVWLSNKKSNANAIKIHRLEYFESGRVELDVVLHVDLLVAMSFEIVVMFFDLDIEEIKERWYSVSVDETASLRIVMSFLVFNLGEADQEFDLVQVETNGRDIDQFLEEIHEDTVLNFEYEDF